MEKELLRPDEVAQILNISRWTVYRWVQEGRIQGSKIGKGSLRIFKSSIEHLIVENQVNFPSHADELSASKV